MTTKKAKKPTSKKSTKKIVKKTTKKAATKVAQKTKVKAHKIGIFGGTFNPIHYGHLNSLETVQKELGLNEVWVVPTSKNPLRNNVDGATAEQRLEMVLTALPLINQGQEIFAVRDNE